MSETSKPTKTHVFLVYCKRKPRFSKYAMADVLGPVFSTEGEANDEVVRLREKGWDATWVGLSSEARWIVT